MIPYEERLGQRLIAKAASGEIILSELERYMANESAFVRAAVAVAYGEVGKRLEGGNAFRRNLITLMEDDEELVAGDAVSAAAAIGDKGYIPNIVEVYDKHGHNIKSRVINALGAIGGDESKAELENLKQTEKNADLLGIITKILETFK
jgi:HEAT repeat protein